VIPFQDITHPDDIEENLSFVGRMLAGEIDNFQMEKRYIHKNGSIVWAQLNVAHLRDREGRSLYSISQIVDITHHKLMEEELRLTVEKYQNLAEGTEAVLWEYNIGLDRWTYVAPQAEWILGWAPDQWKNLNFWTDHIHEDDRTWAVDYCFACTSRGERHTFEYRFYAGNGNLL
jgi:diguanylate cyclase